MSPLTTNIKALKHGEKPANNAAVSFAEAALPDSQQPEWIVWLSPEKTFPKTADNLAETAFIEPFWNCKRLASNDDMLETTNCELRRVDFSAVEIGRRNWTADEELAAVRRALKSNDIVAIPVLTNVVALKAGDELVWRDATWKKEKKPTPEKAVLLPSANHSILEHARSVKRHQAK